MENFEHLPEEIPTDVDPSQITWLAINRLSKDLKDAATLLTRSDVRALVDLFYMQQRQRIRINNQITAAKKDARSSDLLGWALNNQKLFESNCQRALEGWCQQYEIVDRWVKKIYGVGPIITAGMLAHLDEKPPPTVGHWWSFAGIIPGLKKEKGVKRKWNGTLKTLLWKMSSVQVRLYAINPEKSVYGKLYYDRREYETQTNLSGKLSGQAQMALSEKNYSKETDAYKWYSGQYTARTYHEYLTTQAHYADLRRKEGDSKKRQKLAEEQTKALGELLSKNRVPEGTGQPMLPPLHIHARALRWVEKIFLSHWHHVAYEITYQVKPPRPWIIEHDPRHVHVIPPPHWTMME